MIVFLLKDKTVKSFKINKVFGEPFTLLNHPENWLKVNRKALICLTKVKLRDLNVTTMN